MGSFELNPDRFVFSIDPEKSEPSDFDKALVTAWDGKMSLGLFRYIWKIEEEKVLGDKFGFVLQLNPLRSAKRRKPELIENTSQPFDPDKFNFTKLKPDEFIFQIKNGDDMYNYIAINDSPIDKAHSLLLPDMHKKQPQVVTGNGLRFSIGVILSSSVPFLRVGFNGLCAYASINHLHFHIYYLNKQMVLETVPVKHLSGNCYFQDTFPSKGYVFQIKSPRDIDIIIEDVVKLTNYLNENNIAHNLIMTRGTSFERNDSTVYDCVRIYVWPRTSASGCKDISTQNFALCELFGHFPLNDKKLFDESTEEELADMLWQLTDGVFESTRTAVKNLYKQ
ncbi:GDP-D-glucose phosphorylase 1 [Cimex lectularius]|uniref:GDP-D-glucose phosphorylase 1 n=1 Tax=Cimex lectularius TaxID=79782 RepID=A0A8I6RLG1_CIMLE|nr:GDP-D-glucose phosphorylase 1 [Cimex lectularius]XP_014248431.1 GDP-D-glucose phosphorylase 1 [Cimex lectularius]